MKLAVIGCGNVGKAVVDAALNAEDIELVGIVDKKLAGLEVANFIVVEDIEDLADFDVAVLAVPSRLAPDIAEGLLEKGKCVVDSFDIHSKIVEVRSRLDKVAKKAGAASVIAAGWDPGTDSVIRVLLEAMAPQGLTYTNFGPGMSMGHSVAAKAVKGVADALSMTMPIGSGLHRRMVYVELEEGASFEEVKANILADDYFKNDESHVILVDKVADIQDMGHGVKIERKAVSGAAQNQRFSFDMTVNNPALTGQILLSTARAVKRQKPGCYTLIEIPPIDFLPGKPDEIIGRLV